MDLIKSIKSFRYAIKGLKYVLKENNMQIHILATILVTVAGFYFHLRVGEWLWISSAIFLVFITETFNTAIEHLVNLVSPKFNPLAGKVKDRSFGRSSTFSCLLCVNSSRFGISTQICTYQIIASKKCDYERNPSQDICYLCKLIVNVFNTVILNFNYETF